MAAHRLRIDFDEATGKLKIEHRATAEVAGQSVSFAEPVHCADADELKAWAKKFIDANRAEMDRRAGLAAVEHVAAIGGTVKKGRKQLTMGGSVGAIGARATKKKE